MKMWNRAKWLEDTVRLCGCGLRHFIVTGYTLTMWVRIWNLKPTKDETVQFLPNWKRTSFLWERTIHFAIQGVKSEYHTNSIHVRDVTVTQLV